jgi:hypothetical protein
MSWFRAGVNAQIYNGWGAHGDRGRCSFANQWFAKEHRPRPSTAETPRPLSMLVLLGLLNSSLA